MKQFVRDRYARLDALEATYTKKIRLALLREIEVLVALVAAGASADMVAAMVSTKTIKTTLEDLYLRVIQQEAKHQYIELVGEKKATPTLPISDWLRRARNFVATESSKAIVAITATTRNQVKKVLKESLATGESIQQTARSLREKMTQFSVKRATTIARTELIGAANFGSLVGAQSTGLALDKMWLATSDGRTRANHSLANGQVVDINSNFSVGGEQCQYPADPALSAKERCRCRCTQIHRPKSKPGDQLRLPLL